MKISNLYTGDKLVYPLEITNKKRKKVNIIALGDVGRTMLLGLQLLGGEIIEEIGIFDMNHNNVLRLEHEMNQIMFPFEEKHIPPVKVIEEEQLCHCDVLIFCASKGVPDLGAKGDVRMMQLEANKDIIAHYASLTKKANFQGMVAVVSDPVDPLSKAFLLESGLAPGQVQGFGLGVMNARAKYYAKKEPKLAAYLEEGRAFGPHGKDLVIANSIENYDDELSRELTQKVTTANLAVRELGFKPYIAPALSSAAISIILMLEGKWHYSCIWFGEAFLGIKNKVEDGVVLYEDLDVCEELYARIKGAYDNLCLL